MKWELIETAPMDGTKILVINGAKGGVYGGYGDASAPFEIGVAYYCDRLGPQWMAAHCCDQVSVFLPTHWMPLPEPPEQNNG